MKKEKIGKDDLVLLYGDDKSYVINKNQKKFFTRHGLVDLEKITYYGQKAKTPKGKEFVALRPTITDLLMKKCKRMPQVILPKDAAQIVATTGATNGWTCLDAGAGSGFLSMFLANTVKPDGHVTCYERDKKFAENVKKNVTACGLDEIITVKNKNANTFTEKNIDLVTLDMTGAEKIVKKCYDALKPGGWLCVYSPHIEQQKNVVKEMHKCGFSQMHTVENIRRRWQINNYKGGFSHPKYSEGMHTGFITFARKIY
jgi:tRNA (adenine57-N1/adenine58-N1)-methyltransferase catalytic subunit